MSWTLIEHQALSSSVASVTLGSGGTIPQTYKTLRLLITMRADGGGGGSHLLMLPNGSTSSLTSRWLTGSGSATSSWTATDGTVGNTQPPSYTANTFSSHDIAIPNYSGSTNKPVSWDGVEENNATEALQFIGAFLWSNTAAITSLQIKPEGGVNFVSGSTFTLYGLA